MSTPAGRTAALSAVSGILAALGGCGGAARGVEAEPQLPEYPPAVEGKRSEATPVASARPPLVVAAPQPAKNCCKGRNDCKGKGNCKTEHNDCKGRNECKGKGGCKAADCH